MISYFRLAIFVTVASIATTIAQSSPAAALDFDRDGLDDVVVVNINSSNKLEWSAVDVNDTAKRSLGEFGVAGNHLAVGTWSEDGVTSRALIARQTSGAYEWNVDLAAGNKKFVFGSYPAKVISGMDVDNNGIIDPATVSVGSSGLEWKVLPDPTSASGAGATLESRFGGKTAVPFFANLDGTGDQIGNAAVNEKTSVLTVRTKTIQTGKVKTFKITNFKSSLDSVLPVKTKNGKDILFVVSKSGTKYNFDILNGGKKPRRVSVATDGSAAVLVGKFLGGTTTYVAVRKNANEVTLLNNSGSKKTISLALSGILVDDVNINSFDTTTSPVTNPGTTPRTPKASNPVCSGTMLSTLHLLYKPASDTTGNAVIVFDGVYKKEFLTVAIQLRDGTYEQAFWTGLVLWGNPDSVGPRQHWRTSKRASQIADNAIIIANDGTQECRYQLPGSSNRRWE